MPKTREELSQMSVEELAKVFIYDEGDLQGLCPVCLKPCYDPATDEEVGGTTTNLPVGPYTLMVHTACVKD